MVRHIALLSLFLGLAACRPGDVAPGALELPALRVDLPVGWERQAPTSSMRAAQARVLGPGGAAEFTVFHFGEGKGGSVAENLQRWSDQIEFAPGSSTAREEFAANGYTIYRVDFAGTLKAGTMGMGPAEAQPDSRILGAIVEGPGGPWYFKLTGPDATVEQHRDAFLRMLESVRAR